MLKQGDWILDEYDALGYITNVHQDTDQISARFIRTSNGHEMKRTSLKKTHEIRPATIEYHEKSLRYLIDLALKMNDKEWFRELTNKLPIEGEV